MAQGSKADRVAVVTGANKGIGFFIAQQLVSSGEFAHVVLGCRDRERGERAASEVGGEFMQLDLGDVSSIEAFADEVQAKYGRLDCLVNNAGTAFKAADPTPFKQQTGPTLKVNFYGLLALTELLLPLLRKTDSPRLVNVASSSGYLGQLSPPLQNRFTSSSLTMAELKGLVNKFEQDVAAGRHQQEGWSNSNYGLSKLAVIAATKVWARENPDMLANACCPGYCDTDMTSHRGPRPPADGARQATDLALLANGGPTGKFFRNGEETQW